VKSLLLLLPCVSLLTAERPPIVGIANFVAKMLQVDVHVRESVGEDKFYKDPGKPVVARLFCTHGKRTEMMIRKPVEKPCRSENLDVYDK